MAQNNQDWFAVPIPADSPRPSQPGKADSEASPLPSPVHGSASSLTLQLETPGSQPTVFSLNKDRLTIGRSDPREGVVPDIDLGAIGLGHRERSVSRRHAELMRTERGYTITDLGSTLGTLVNDRRLDAGAPHQIEAGDHIDLGQVRLYVRMS